MSEANDRRIERSRRELRVLMHRRRKGAPIGSEEVAAATRAFLKRGGKIEEVPPAEADAPPNWTRLTWGSPNVQRRTAQNQEHL